MQSSTVSFTDFVCVCLCAVVKVLLLVAVGGVPPSRWIVNFDFNLLDSLVLATLLAAYAPFLVCCLAPALSCYY